MDLDLAGLRAPYNARTSVFLESDIVVKDPFELFHTWLEEAKNNSSIIEPNAMCLATATREGIPSARFVLCKGYGRDGFRFFTHYTSRKGNELVRIEGNVEKLPMSDAEEYFSKRPYPSQIGALCSDQSNTIESRKILESRASELRCQYKEGEGGYKVVPKCFEFWQGQTDRIHDRIRFRLPKENEVPDNKITFPADDGWIYERLQP